METPKTGYQVQSYDVPVNRYCQTLDLRDSPELIAEYRKRHSQAEAWPEILAGIREVGILEMEIYILGTRLFMIVETPLDFDWDTAMERLNTLPRQQEWEEYMAIFQQAAPGMSSAEKWKPMERMFHLYNTLENTRNNHETHQAVHHFERWHQLSYTFYSHYLLFCVMGICQ